jgi:hypothetical protein
MDYNLTQATYTIPKFGEALGLGINSIYNAINSGELKTISVGARKLITAPDGAAYLDSRRDVAPKFIRGWPKGKPRKSKEAASG